MPRSRRNTRRRKKIAKKRSRSFLFWIMALFVSMVVVASCLSFWKLSKMEKFSYVRQSEDGGAEILIVDPQKENVVSIYIPPNTQIELSQSLGVYKIGNSWKLSEKEGMGGELVARSIVKNFYTPVYYWQYKGDSNLTLFKKIKVWMMDKKISSYSFVSYDLRDGNVLKEEEFKDGSDGYVVVNQLPSYILINFGLTEFSDVVAKVEIVDASGSYNVAEKVSRIVSTMGAKVSSYSKEFPGDYDCEISGRDQKIVDMFSKVFECNKKTSYEGEGDILIRLGKQFTEKF